ncbi:MAG: phage holin family protein [Acidimicrobiia bacterium]
MLSTSEPGSSGSRESDWPAQAADKIEQLVGTVRDKTTGPALKAARAVVYGLLGAILGVAVVILVLIGAVRLLVSYLPGERVWLAYLILGVVFVALGGFCWSRRTKPSEES